MEVINLTPLRVGWKLTLLISITYIISLSSILIYQTYPLSILEKMDLGQYFGHKKVKFLSNLSCKLLTFFWR